MYDFDDQFSHYSFFDHLNLAYFYAELVLIDLYVSSIDGKQGTLSQRYYNRMLLNACMAKLIGGIK